MTLPAIRTLLKSRTQRFSIIVYRGRECRSYVKTSLLLKLQPSRTVLMKGYQFGHMGDTPCLTWSGVSSRPRRRHHQWTSRNPLTQNPYLSTPIQNPPMFSHGIQHVTVCGTRALFECPGSLCPLPLRLVRRQPTKHDPEFSNTDTKNNDWPTFLVHYCDQTRAG